MQNDIELTGQRISAPRASAPTGPAASASAGGHASAVAGGRVSAVADGGGSAVADGDDEAAERVRWELATMAGRLRAAEAERDAVRRQHDGMLRERDRAREVVRTMRRSESYRLGRAVVSFVKNPVRTSPRLVRGAIRRLRQAPDHAIAPGRGSRTTIDGTAVPMVSRRSVPAPPVHLYVAIGLEPDKLRALVRTVSQHALVNAAPQPVVVTDSPTFSLLRDLGVILEYIPDRVTWERHREDVRWDDVLANRLARLFLDHSAVRTVVVNRRDPQTLPQLLSLTT